MEVSTQAERALPLIGLARRAGRALTGTFLVQKAVADGRGVLVVVATDASEKTKKKLKNSCRFYEVSCLEYATKAELSHITGKENIAAVCITDPNFADGIMKKAASKHNT